MKSLEICDTRKEALAILMKGRKERKVSLPTSLASLRILPKRYTENKVNTLSGLGKQFITDREKALLQMIEHLLPNCEEKITLHDLKNSRTLFVKILYWSELQLHIIRGSWDFKVSMYTPYLKTRYVKKSSKTGSLVKGCRATSRICIGYFPIPSQWRNPLGHSIRKA